MNSAVVGNLKLLLSLDSSNFDKGVTNSEANVKKLSDRLSKDLAPSQQRINSLIRDFVGNKEITNALNYAKAIEAVGGANKLTASEQARTNRVVEEAIEKYRALGQEAPAHLLALSSATKQAKNELSEFERGVRSLVGQLSFAGAIDSAHQYVAAIEQVGGVANLTESEQAKVNSVVTEAIRKYQQLGQEVPRALSDIAIATTKIERETIGLDAQIKKLDHSEKGLTISLDRVNDLVKDLGGGRAIQSAEEYAAAVRKIGGASALTAAEQSRVNAAVQTAITKYGALGQQAPAHLLDLANATKQVKKPTEDLGGSMTSLLGKARSLAGIFGVTLGAGALVSFAKHTFDAADQIGDLALKMGISTDAAQRFQYAARQSGAELEDVTSAIVKMNDNLATGDKSTVAALESAGLSFGHIRTLKPEDAFREIADAIGRIPDPMIQSRVAMDLFGKSGASLLPMIRENSLAVADGAEIMSAETIQALKDAQQAWDNFFGWLTIKSGNVIADIATLWRNLGAVITGELGNIKVPKVTREPTFGEVLTNPFGAAMMRLNNAFAPLARAGEKVDAAIESMPTIGRPSLFNPQTDDALTRSRAAADKAVKDKEIDDKRVKDATEAQKRLNEAYRAFERERLTGATDAQRQRAAFEARFLSEHGLTAAAAWGQSIVGKATDWGSILAGGQFSVPNAPIPILPGMNPNAFGSIVNSIDIKKLTKGALGVEDLLRGVKVPVERFGKSLQGLFSLMPQTLLASFQGGGNPLKSLASMFGGGLLGAPSIGGKITDKLTGSFLGKTFGGALGNIIPGVGALLGPALGKLFGAIGNIGANTTKKAREDFAKQLGFEGLDNLYTKLRSLGAEGEKFANIGLNIIGKKDKAANEKWMKDVTAFFDRLEKVPGKVQELSSALGKFGGAIPKQLEPMLDALLGNSALSGDLRRQLEGMKKPSWQAALEMADAFGVDKSALGRGFNQSRIADSAFEIKRAVDLFGRFEGSDRDAVLRGLADELSGVASEAKKNNVALPKEVESLVRRVDELGLLLDENGERIDSSVLTFADIEDEYQKQVVGLLEQIRDLLAGGPGASVVGAGAGSESGFTGADARVWRGYDPGMGEPIQMPGFAGGTHGQFFDFGAGTPVMLHGKERVMTAGEGAGGGFGQVNIYALDSKSFEEAMDRGGITVIAKKLTPYIERMGLARG